MVADTIFDRPEVGLEDTPLCDTPDVLCEMEIFTKFLALKTQMVIIR